MSFDADQVIDHGRLRLATLQAFKHAQYITIILVRCVTEPPATLRAIEGHGVPLGPGDIP